MNRDDANESLLTRRQVIALFGGTLGAAMVAEASADLDGGASGGATLVGGAAQMAELFKVGPGLWKGPLSVRSDVPKEDGNDFLQTDAGASNNLYQLWHYNAGWAAQGLDLPSITTEQVDTDKILSGYGVIVRGPMNADRQDLTRKGQNFPVAVGMMSDINDGSFSHTTFTTSENDIYEANGPGAINSVAVEDNDNFIRVAVTHSNDYWLTICDAAVRDTARIYDSVGDIGSAGGAAVDSMTDVKVGRPWSHVSMWDTNQTGSDNRTFIWGEYTDSAADNPRVIKAYGSSGFSTKLTLNDVRHIHSIDHDPFNPGTLWMSTGDSNDASRFYRSTDFGENWTLVESGEQKYRVLRINFTQDHMYWADDNTQSGCRFWRATRSGTDTPTELVDFSDTAYGDFGDLVSYGTARIEQPNGILISMIEPAGTLGRVPLFFWDIEAGELRRVFQWEMEAAGTLQGVQSLAPHIDTMTGKIYARLQNVADNWRAGQNNRADGILTYEIDPAALMQ